MAIICYPLDDTDYVASDAGAFFASRTSGVYSADDNLAVTIVAARQLEVAPGIAWIRTDTYWGKVIVNTADITLTLPDADGVLDRICRVVARWDKTANALTIILRPGELSIAPVAPTRNTSDELYELVLADYLIEHGETEASAANLTDQRLNEDLCGLMRDGVTRLPSSAMYAQFMALLSAIQEELAQAESGTAYDMKPVRVENVSIPSSAFTDYTPTSDTEESALMALGYAKRAAVAVANAISSMTPYITLSLPDVDAAGVGIANQFACYNGGVYIYADGVPGSTITALTIECRKAVS